MNWENIILINIDNIFRKFILEAKTEYVGKNVNK